MSDKKSNKEQEIEIFNRFSRIVKEKFTSLSNPNNSDGANNKMNQLDTLYKQPEFASEKKLLNELNNMGLYKGVLSGLACFAFLRVSPRMISGVLRRRAGLASEGTSSSASSTGAGGGTKGTTTFGSGSGGNNPFRNQSAGGYKFDPPPSSSASSSASASSAGAGTQNVQRPGLIFRTIRLALDSFVSLSIGAYASMYFVDKDKMMKQFSDIPLVEGRSLLSEELCEDFTREFQKFDRKTWDPNHPSFSGSSSSSMHSNNNNEETTTADFRSTIQGFVLNCKRRAINEDEIRKEQGLRSGGVVVIPSGGVSRDIPVSLGDLLEDGGGGGDNNNNSDDDGSSMMGDDYFDSYFDNNVDDDKQH